MNIKMKQRFVSLLLCAAMLFSLCPQPVFAEESGQTGSGKNAIVLGTGGITGWDSANGYDYIYYGTGDGSPIKWRVLDNKTNTGDTGLFLLSDVLFGTGSNGGVCFDKASPYSNAWQGSDAQAWCKDFAGEDGAESNIIDAFTAGELNAILATTKSDDEFDPDTSDSDPVFLFAASENILSGDKVFFLSAEEAKNNAYGFTDNAARVAYYGDNAAGWWLRSPAATIASLAGAVNRLGALNLFSVYDGWTARPAFNLDSSAILFTSAAENGKSDTAVDKNLTAISTGVGIGEWKLTLKDSNRGFSVTSDTAVTAAQGSTVDVAYAGAKTGSNEYVSAMIVQGDTILYYGRVAQDSASGTASITIPADLAVGDYTLKVFSEQYNGDKKTDYASGFVDISLTVVIPDTTPPVLSGSTAARESVTTATVTFTSNEAGTYYYAVVASGAAAPSDLTTSGTSGDCAEGANTISLTNLSAGKKDIYIVAKDAASNVSKAIKIEIPASALPTPQDIHWDSATPGKATWSAVTGATGYSVQLYKDGGAPGTAVPVTGTDHTFTITEAGSYKFAVQATGGETYKASAWSEQSAALDYYAVTFEPNGADGGGPVDEQIVANGGKVTEPTAPTKTGYTFMGWYSDANFSEESKWDFERSTIMQPTTLYAKWTENQYTVTVQNDGNGRASADPASAKAGEVVTLTATPAEGYHFVRWEVISGGVTITDNTFTMPMGDVIVKATFEADSYTVTVQNDGNGTASADHTSAKAGEVVTLTATPAEGYHFVRWEVVSGGVTITDNAFTMPEGGVTVKATFEADSYTVTVQNDGNGRASADRTSAKAGEVVTLTATPAEGYHFVRWQVISGGVTITDNTFTMPMGDVTVKAVFEADSYTVTVQNDGHGTASADHTSAKVGEVVTLTATPAEGYHFVRWEVVSGSVTISADNTFTMPEGGVIVKAIFEAHQAVEPEKWKHNSREHWKVCSECGERFYIESHDLKQVSAKAATCTEDGNIEYWYCAVCDSYFADAAATKEITQEETVTAKIPHTYDITTWKTDETSHWHECTCGAVTDKAAHTPGPDATETTPQICTECGRVLKPALEHTHQYGEEWEQDDSNHWHECSCGAETAKAPHDFGPWVETKPATETETGSRKKSCQTCGYTVTEEIPQLDPDKPTDPDEPLTPDEPKTPIDPETPEYREEYQLKQNGLGAQVLEQFRDVPGIETVEDIERKLNDELTRVLTETMQPDEAEPQTALFDVRLQVKRNGGWEDVHADDFPEEGILVWLCDLVSDVDQATHSFVVTHMLATDRDDKKAGEVETLTLAQGQRGLYFVVHSLSPIGVAWTENTAEPEKPVQPTSGGDTEALIGAAVVIGGGAALLAYHYREDLPIWKLGGVVVLTDETAGAATPAANAAVELYQNGQLVKTLTTDADGRFAARLPKGTYEAVVTWERDGVTHTAREQLLAERVWDGSADVQEIVLTEQTGE